ncbi:MAG TPA: ABC transporter substrate-binding protein, partial [Gaiellaceae bacterium]|nr:ABC transporter substrate-binding protein [Gaiellaceae bacterium]
PSGLPAISHSGILAETRNCGGTGYEKGELVTTRWWKWPALAGMVLALTVLTAGCGGGGDGDTLTFGAAADPVVLDGALVSDGESLRVIDQIFETLVGLEPGTTRIVPELATSWEASDDGLEWTFELREDVTFHDGEPFNAEAVCFNFNRWYNFSGPLQSSSVSYYWQTVFRGYANNEDESLDPSLYESCEVQNELTAVIRITEPSSAFLGALALKNFAIASPKALTDYEADAGTVDEEAGVFQPGGTYGTEHATGTGPFKFDSWEIGDKLTLVRNDDYWGEPAKLGTLIFRPIPDNAARLQALQTGEIQGYDLVEPQDIATIEADENLQVLDRPAFNVGYVTINQAKPPMDNPLVRQAVAHGLDRRSVVDNFYAGRGDVAHQFMPPLVEGYADSVTQYDYDPERAKALLQEAGLSLPVPIEFWYPTDVSRPYMPDPKRNFEAFAASLNQSGFRVTARSAVWNPTYLGRQQSGNAGHLNLIGWTGDYGDPDNFVGTFFQSRQPAWGTDRFPNEEVMDLLNRAERETDIAERTALYKEANRMIAEWIPGVPYVHTSPALAFQANVTGYAPSPVSLESFALVEFTEES